MNRWAKLLAAFMCAIVTADSVGLAVALHKTSGFARDGAMARKAQCDNLPIVRKEQQAFLRYGIITRVEYERYVSRFKC